MGKPKAEPLAKWGFGVEEQAIVRREERAGKGPSGILSCGASTHPGWGRRWPNPGGVSAIRTGAGSGASGRGVCGDLALPLGASRGSSPAGIRGGGTAAHGVLSQFTAVAGLWRGPRARSTGRHSVSPPGARCRSWPQTRRQLRAWIGALVCKVAS